ncbi:MAG TPA: sigma-70 family RNA polymerase sigma factor [Pirellulales bacterium]|nr:sigma-70 family RNA polymerase sigma factor [Pirellulales bacterium]
MSLSASSDQLLVGRIRAGEPEAWNELIARFEGRLLVFVEGRLGRRTAGEDVVQETFLGFLNSLPNFEDSRPLESYLFSIAAHKLTDHLRREGRRPTLPLAAGSSTSNSWEPPDRARAVSSAMRSGERKHLEEQALVAALVEQIDRLRSRGEWQKLQCLELLFVRGWANRDVATTLKMSEQTVANFKFEFLSRLRTLVRKQGLSEDIFPELHETA